MAQSDGSAVVRPPRGTRPANRRQLILRAATELFYRKGYSQVSMREIAEAVAIGPSALYRHFANKQDLLFAVVADALGVVEAVLDRLLADPTLDPAAQLAQTILQHRAIGALWHSEGRHLTSEGRTRLRHTLRGIGSRLADVVQRQRSDADDATADLLAWCILAVTTSVAFHNASLPTDRFVALLAELARAATDATVPPLQPADDHIAAHRQRWAPTRREAILDSAAKLFARNGFAGVGVEDIGASVGITGPSVYNHFDAKEDILSAAVNRGRELLHADMHRQVRRAADPRDALRRLLTGYGDYVLESPESIQLLITETGHLSPQDQERIRTAQHEYIAEWTRLLRQVEPQLGPVAARIRVQAALSIINDVAATPHLRALCGLEPAVIAVSAAVLGLD